jgi:adenylosuccinate lyase
MSTALHAITPVDGRYASKTEALSQYFSEFALIKYRVRVEIEYFIALCKSDIAQLADVDPASFEPLRDLYRNFDTADAQKNQRHRKGNQPRCESRRVFHQRGF